jgi:lysylphosphatidylglycerol synthetase-like protein (DUF2156 family)
MSNPNDGHPVGTGSFWKATLERVITTMIVCFLALLLATWIIHSLYSFDWVAAIWPALAAGVLSLIKCLLASLGGNPGPSVANETLTDYPRVGRIS